MDLWQWTGNTLNPYNEQNKYTEMIDNEKLIYHTVDNWCFGEDNTGNLLHIENFRRIKEQMSEIGMSVNLVIVFLYLIDVLL